MATIPRPFLDPEEIARRPLYTRRPGRLTLLDCSDHRATRRRNFRVLSESGLCNLLTSLRSRRYSLLPQHLCDGNLHLWRKGADTAAFGDQFRALWMRVSKSAMGLPMLHVLTSPFYQLAFVTPDVASKGASRTWHDLQN